MFDTHCHLQEFDEVAPVIARARAVGVRNMMLAGVFPSRWGADDRLCARHDELYVSYGVHPQTIEGCAPDSFDDFMQQLDERLAQRRPRVIAVGEIGLDGQYPRSLDEQERYFRAQLRLAKKHGLPVALHVLRQHPRALHILADEQIGHGVLHSCSASPELVREYVKLGFHISFSGSVTWHKGENKAARAVAEVPRDKLVVETDAPDQTPEPHRPGQNEPAFLVAIVGAVAHLWRVEFADAARITDENARRLFAVP